MTLGLFLSLDHDSLDVRNLRDFLMYSVNSKPLLSPLCIANLSDNIIVQFLSHTYKRCVNSIHLFCYNIYSTRHWGEDIIKNLHLLSKMWKFLHLIKFFEIANERIIFSLYICQFLPIIFSLLSFASLL